MNTYSVNTYTVGRLSSLGDPLIPLITKVLVFKSTDVYSISFKPLPSLAKVGTVNPGVSLTFAEQISNPFGGQAYTGVFVGTALRVIQGTSTITFDPPVSPTAINVQSNKSVAVLRGPAPEFAVAMTIQPGTIATVSAEVNGYYRIGAGQWADKTAFQPSSTPPGKPKPKSFDWKYIIIAGGATFLIASALGVRKMIKVKRARKASKK